MHFSRYRPSLIRHPFGLSKGLEICLHISPSHIPIINPIPSVNAGLFLTHLHSHFIGTFSCPRNRLLGQQNQRGEWNECSGLSLLKSDVQSSKMERFNWSRLKMVSWYFYLGWPQLLCVGCLTYCLPSQSLSMVESDFRHRLPWLDRCCLAHGTDYIYI